MGTTRPTHVVLWCKVKSVLTKAQNISTLCSAPCSPFSVQTIHTNLRLRAKRARLRIYVISRLLKMTFIIKLMTSQTCLLTPDWNRIPFKGGGSVVVDFLFIVTLIVGVCNCSCFVVRYFMSILVLHSSWWERESWLLCLICLPGVSDVCAAIPRGATGLSAVCDCGISWSYSLFFM